MKPFLGIAVLAVLVAVVPASAVRSFFDVFVETTSAGPPYPTSATQTKFFQGELPNPPQIGAISMGIHDVTGTPLAAHMQALDPAGGPGLLSTSAFLDIVLEASQPAPPPPTSSFFDIWMEPLSNGGQPGSIPSGSGGFKGSGSGGYFSYFDVSLNVVTDGGEPRLLRLHGEPASGQPVHFAGGSSLQVVGSKLHIVPNVVFDGPVNSGLPLCTITMTPEPLSMLLLLIGAGLLRRPRRA